jgi:hypothetical protein
VATVEDPFGNTLGIIENPEFRAEVWEVMAWSESHILPQVKRKNWQC